MARAGVYFSDVKRARDALIARGRRPSIDAVRVELGDTGSKTTIHKYLRELEEQDERRSFPLGETIQELISKLAEQLKTEADVLVNELREQLTAERRQHELEVAAAGSNLAQSRASNDELNAQLSASAQHLTHLRQQLHEEQIARQSAEQRSRDLEERVGDAERHQRSLEEKHGHAREALEHFRTAAKEQREQESRRHEQQVQSAQVELRQAQQTVAVKHEQLTQLNREAASLAAELGAVKEALYREKEAGRALARRIEQLQSTEARAGALEAQFADTRARYEENVNELAKTAEACSDLRQRNAALESQLANARLSNGLEEKIALLQKAVFGSEQASTTPETTK